MVKYVLIVALGGGVGSVFRYLISLIIGKYASNFPFSTVVVNVVGCFIIGILVGVSEKHQYLPQSIKLLLITGFCGGFTTFSTFAIENIKMLESGKLLLVILYISLSIILGLVATFVGLYVASKLLAIKA